MPKSLAVIPCYFLLMLLCTSLVPAQNKQDKEGTPAEYRAGLLLAIEERDLRRARQVIQDGGGSVIDQGDPSPLGEAVRIDHLNMVALLLRSGGDPNTAVDEPLMEALRNDSIDMVRLLFQVGAKLSDADMEAALRLTLRGENALAIYRELLSQGANVNVALKAAVEGRKLEATQLCLERGGDVATLGDLNILRLNGLTADQISEIFTRAVRDDSRDALSYFLSVAAADNNRRLVDLALSKGASITVDHLAKAEEQGHDEMVGFLLESSGEDLGTMIEYAENQGHEDLTAYLKSLRNQKISSVVWPVVAGLAGLFVLLVTAFFFRKNVLQSPPRLMNAVLAGDHPRIEKLLAAGADPNARHEGEPLLFVAAKQKDLKMIRLLQRYRADANLAAVSPSSDAGHGPLHLIAHGGHIPLAELLVRGGGDVNRRTSDGRPPLYLAARAGHEQMVHFLVERGADAQAQIHQQPMVLLALKEQAPSVAKLLLEVGADPNAATEMGRTALHAAAELGDVELIDLLLELGANHDARDREGQTPQALAIFHKKIPAAQILQAQAPVSQGPPSPPPAATVPLPAAAVPATTVPLPTASVPPLAATVPVATVPLAMAAPPLPVFDTLVIPPPESVPAVSPPTPAVSPIPIGEALTIPFPKK